MENIYSISSSSIIFNDFRDVNSKTAMTLTQLLSKNNIAIFFLSAQPPDSAKPKVILVTAARVCVFVIISEVIHARLNPSLKLHLRFEFINYFTSLCR